MFKAVAEDRPYPASGLSAALWKQVPARHVPISDLIATQGHLHIAALHPTHRTSHCGDRLIHVIKWEGHLYLEDGHHRVVRERLAGADWINARVFDLDRHGPYTPPEGPALVSADEQADLPGLVWVEGKGYRSVHLARALESAGGRVDWSRWTEGTPAELKPLQYRDVA